jgi:hypothetical protein
MIRIKTAFYDKEYLQKNPASMVSPPPPHRGRLGGGLLLL